jgi:protein SCO1
MMRQSTRALRSALMLLTCLGAAALSSACSDVSWHGVPLGPDFPPLAFELDVAGDERITEASVHGAVTLLFFGYMSCPDVCPATMANLGAAIASLPGPQRDRVRVVFVSVDPERDEPARLASYAAHFGPQFIGATADADTVRQLASRYGTTFQSMRTAGDPGHYLVAHGSHVYAFDGSGRARLMIRHDQVPGAIADDLERLLRG